MKLKINMELIEFSKINVVIYDIRGKKYKHYFSTVEGSKSVKCLLKLIMSLWGK